MSSAGKFVTELIRITKPRVNMYVDTQVRFGTKSYGGTYSYDSPRVHPTSTNYIACSTTDPCNYGPATVLWDSDSFPIRVDNCCTKTISFDINDFDKESLEPVLNRTVSGFVEGSTTAIEQKGTIRWKILDDAGTLQSQRSVPLSLKGVPIHPSYPVY
jgi:hypothetical protein